MQQINGLHPTLRKTKSILALHKVFITMLTTNDRNNSLGMLNNLAFILQCLSIHQT